MSADESPFSIDLANEAQFALGDLEVRPSTRELLSGDRRGVLEPRIMQVLVALARRRGQVVSRHELLASCWGGLAVGEDAINRCIHAIRRLAEAYGGFAVTTVARVGYRLDESTLPFAKPATPRPATLAVLAFDNLSGDAEMDYFSDGLSEEILQTVARGADLKVIGRGSTFRFRGADKAAANVAKALHASHVLDGAVRRSGARVRVSAHLVECGGETILWSERFERDLTDIFALQDEIAGAVAKALKLAFAPSAVPYLIDPVAYDLYLRSKTLDPGRLGSFNAGLLEAATAIAPGFAQAWQALAITHAVDALFAPSGDTVGALRASAAKAAEKALALDPKAGQAYVALSLIEPICGRFAERETLLEWAIAAAPHDPIVLFHASRAAYAVGRVHEALRFIEEAHKLDLWPQGENWYSVMLSYGGRVSEAESVWRDAIRRWPRYEILTVNGVIGLTGKGDWEGVDALADEAHRLGVDSAWLRDSVETARILREGGPMMKQRLLAPFRRQLAATGTMSLRVKPACAMGFVNEVYALLAEASFAHLFEPDARLVGNDFGLHVIFQPPALRGDVRFVQLCAELGLCDYWVKSGRWPDCADEVSYDFRAEARRLVGARV